MISQGQHAQHMTNVENSGTTKELNNRHGYSGEEDGSVKCLCGTRGRSSVDIVSGDEEAHRTTMDVTDDEEERWESFKRLCAIMRALDIVSGGKEAHQTTTDVTDDEEERPLETWWAFWDDVLDQDLEKRAASIRRGQASLAGRVVHLNILPDSSHRDGSVYRDTHEWKKEYRIADRTESKRSLSLVLFYLLLRHLQIVGSTDVSSVKIVRDILSSPYACLMHPFIV